MDNIIEPTMDYDFSGLYLGPPSTLAGGAYFTRIMYGNNKQLFIQTPKSLTKQGFIKSGKKMYCDLMFDNNDTVFINWIENLESKCQNLIFTKSTLWFESKLEKDDIESAFTSPFKIFKSGKYYLLRVNVKPNIKIYNENDQILTSDELTPDKTVISILEIQGIKFTSRNFQIEIELKQTMVVSPDPFLDLCFIKKPVNKVSNKIKETEFDEENIELDGKTEILEESRTNDLLPNLVDIDSFVEESVKDLEKTNVGEMVPIDLEMQSTDLVEDDNVPLDFEDLTPEEATVLEDPNLLKEVDITNNFASLENNLEIVTLKKPNQVYYELYKKAREKAKKAKKDAILAFLEVKNIKKTYMLDDIDESESDNDDFNLNDGDSQVSEEEILE